MYIFFSSSPGRCIHRDVCQWCRSTGSQYRGGRCPSSQLRYLAVPYYSRHTAYGYLVGTNRLKHMRRNKKKTMMCKFSVKCLGLKSSGLFLGDCQKNRKDLSCVKLSGCMWSQDQFRLGLWSYSPLLTLSAHYGISALHSYVFLIPLFVTNGPLFPDLRQKKQIYVALPSGQ